MVRLGFQVVNSGPLARRDDVLAIAERAEALGYASLVVTDHLVIPHTIRSRYPYDRSGQFFAAPEDGYLDALSTLAFLAAATRTVRLGPSVLVLPYRNPVLTAKMLAAIDVLSSGRLFVGTGAGWLAEEFAILDAPSFEKRGVVCDEWLEIFLRLWTEDHCGFEGAFYRLADVSCYPKPLQKPHPPIYVGGNGRPAIRRAAKYGQNWHASRLTAGALEPLLGYLADRLRAEGRPPGSCGFSGRYGIRLVRLRGDAGRRDFEHPGEVFVGRAGDVVEQIKPVFDLGPTDLIFDCRTGDLDEVLETMERLAADVWPKLGR
jgi:probable F420-dependent oxidoreductase